jgi:hypothetical protein
VAQLGKSAPAYRGAKPEEAEVAESLPRRHPALVLLEDVVPCLGGAAEVVGGDPCAVGRQCVLPTDELLALVEPVEGVLRAIVGGELEFGIAGRRRGRATMNVWVSAGRGGAAKPEEVASE